MWKRILVPLDGSSRAERVLPVAARLVRATGGSLMLVQVVRAVAEFETGAVAPTIWAPAADPEERVQATSYLSHITARTDLADVATLIGVYAGPVVPTLLRLAQSQQVDAIVMSSQGQTGFSAWALGSVAQKVAREARMPVLVVRPSASLPTESNLDAGHTIRALVALDGSRLAETALAPAANLVAALSAPARGALHLVGVAKSEADVREAQAYLRAAAEGIHESALGDLNLTVTWSAELADDVAKALTRRAERAEETVGADTTAGPADVIAIATHGRGGLQRWALGSVTERMLAGTKLPILIIRPPYLEMPDNPLRSELPHSQSSALPDHVEV